MALKRLWNTTKTKGNNFHFPSTLLNFFWLLLFLGYVGGMSAQQINLIQYTAEDGLPSSNIYQVIQDQAGFIWISTDKGVARFDGYEFQNFTIQEGLPSNDVWGMKEDAAGRIWFATFNQLSYYQNGKIITIPFEDGDLFNTPMIVAQWTTSSRKMYASIRENTDNYLLEMEADGSQQKLVQQDFNHAGFLGERKGKQWFYSLPFKSKPQISFIDTLTQKTGEFLIPNMDEEQLLSRKFIQGDTYSYFFTPNNILQFDYEQIKTTPIEQILGKGVIIEDIFPGNRDYQKLILIKTNIGYKILDKDLTPLHLLNQSGVFYKSILEDKNGNIWLAATNGLYLLTSNARFSRFHSLSTNQKPNNCTALLVEDDHTIWAGNQLNELWKIKDKVNKTIALKQNNYTNIPITHLSKWQNKLIAAGDFGIFFLSNKDLNQSLITAKLMNILPNSELNYEFNTGNFLSQPVKAISIKEECLFLSQWSGVSILCQKENTLEREQLKVNRTYACIEDEEGKIWIGKKDGLWAYDQSKIEHIGRQFPVLNYPINDLKIDILGNIWIATDGYGVLYFNHKEVIEINESKKSIPKQLFIDANQRIWSATNRGIGKISIQNKSPFTYEYQQITTAHGLAASEVNQVIVKDNIIYAATNGGLTQIDNQNNFTTNTPTLVIEHIMVNGLKKAVSDDYELSYLENNLKIKYVCLSYESRKQIRYQYKMSGIDTAWQTTNLLVREYPQLQPGNYTFQLKALDIDGNVSEEKKLLFLILPPWWQTTWFKAISALSTIGLVFLFFQLRVRNIKRKEASKTRINKKFAELELQALQAQMNPHFIFNSMNAIQNFIYTKEKRAAGKYIVKFSRLMRLFLNASNQKYSSLEQEIEILQKYVELENLRFEDKFDYEFCIDPSLSLATTKVPALLLQPYVENAINHGLVHKMTKGNLWIRIQKMDNNRLQCVIEDNGIGRAKALEIRQKSFKKHKSRGMALVEERKRVMNFINDQDIQIEVVDLKDDNLRGIGTKVLVTLPITS